MAPFLEKALAPVFRALGVQKSEEQDYPAPLLVRNTFIDQVTQRSVSLDGFFEERAVSSSPASMIDSPDEELKAVVALPKADGSSSCRSTSAGSSSGRSGAVVSPGGLTEASAAEAEPQRVRGLPEFDYPAPVFIKNTFIHADIGRPPSLDTFFDERHLRSCPASVAEEAGAGMPLVESTPLNSPTPWVATALVPALIPVQVLSTTPSTMVPPVPEVPPLLSQGSAKHRRGRCKPCAHVHTEEGCKNGLSCTFCHLCPPGELKRRQKERRKQKARLVAVRKSQAAE